MTSEIKKSSSPFSFEGFAFDDFECPDNRSVSEVAQPVIQSLGC